jgi:hypothetical protein
VNDLDLILIDPGSSRVYPNNASQRGHTAVIAYDDGGATGLYIWTAGNRVGVRFTPTAYPAKLDKGMFLLESASYPNTFNYYVYDGSDGTGPQNILASGSTTIRGGGWHVVDLSSFDLTISSGDFFVAIELDNNLLWYYDSTSPNGRSWDYAGGNWGKNPTDDYMFRAVVTSSDYSTPSDRVNNAVGIDIPSPAAGSYSIRVEGYNVPQGPQPYALVVTGGTLSALTEVTPPVAPSNPSASFAPVAQINLSWTDNSNNESGFRIERKIGAAGSYNPLTTVGPNVTNYNDSGLTEATTYSYRMAAYNAQGDSMYSSEVNATTLPAAPSGLSATAASSSRIDLSWTDNSNGETGYKIERKIGATGTYSQVGTVGANVTSYSNTGLSGSKTYYYHVMAYNVTGDSAQSNEANATTPATPTLASGGGGGGGCFITTAGFGRHLDKSADFTREHESDNAYQIGFGWAFLAALCYVTFRCNYKR